jgi:F-type H+-transporting ATPase subunit alpha
VEQQVIIIYAAVNGYLDAVDVEQVTRYEPELLAFIGQRYPEVPAAIVKDQALSAETEERLKAGLQEFQESVWSNEPKAGGNAATASATAVSPGGQTPSSDGGMAPNADTTTKANATVAA